MNGVLILDKPQGFTSFDAVALMRRLCREKKIGHTGTLDPMATGVLPVLLGSGTRAIPFLEDTDKEYEAEFALGIRTDTGDRTGQVVETSENAVSGDRLRAALPAFCGPIWQIPPMYSAVSVNGQRLYQLARQGKEIERPARPVNIFRLELLGYEEKTRTGRLRIRCSKGTYVRVLIEDIAKACGCVGCMTGLRRTVACGFPLSQAVSVEQMRALAEKGEAHTAIRPVESLFSSWGDVRVTAAQARRFQNGGALLRERLPHVLPTEMGRRRVYGPQGEFLGLGELREQEWAVLRLFPQREE